MTDQDKFSITDYSYDCLSARLIIVWSDGKKTELGYPTKDQTASVVELMKSRRIVEKFGLPFRFPWEPPEHDAALEARKDAFAKRST